VTPDERAGLRQAILNGPGNMSWPSKTVSELLDDLDAARTAANALTIFCRQAGCNDAELTAIFQAYSPDKFSDGIPAWLTPQRPRGDVEEWPR
jgi:hypothetical protein